MDEALGFVGDDRIRDLALQEHAGDVREEQQALGAEADREGCRRLVGIDVHRAVGKRRDDGYPAGGQRVEDRLGRGRDRAAYVAQLGNPDGGEDAFRNRERSRTDGGGDLGIDRGERLADDLEHGVARHAPAVDELDGDPATLELARDLGPRAVDHDDLVALSHERLDPVRRVVRHRATDLDDDEAHEL